MTPCVSYYILFIQSLTFKQKYITGDIMSNPSNIFIDLKSSTLVSNLYGLMRHILHLISVAPYCNITMPLLKHRVITTTPLRDRKVLLLIQQHL